MICAQCEAEKSRKNGDGLPTGWKRVGGEVLCDKCTRDRFALRAVTIPIVSPIGCSWDDLRKMLRESFTATTQAANWVLRQLAAHDPGIDPATAKFGKMPEVRPGGESLYLGVASRWSIDTNTACCLVQAATAKYRKARFDMHRGKVSLPTIRYPHPIPIRNRMWKVAEGEDGGLILNMPLGRKQRVQVRLKGGANYRRQLVDVRRIIAGEVIQGQLDIMEAGTKVLAKMVGWFPKIAKQDGWAAALHTGGDAFVTLYNDATRLMYRWNADHVRRRIAAQDEQMQRLREDLKAEKRLGRDRDGILARMDHLRQHNHDYMHSFCHETTTQIIGHLLRKRCGLLMFVDKDKSYLPHFPWHKFATMLADKANRAGIEFASGDAASESPSPLEEDSQQ